MAMFEPTIDDMISCINRELGYRKAVYARKVAQGSMTQSAADWQVECMKAVLSVLLAKKGSDATHL